MAKKITIAGESLLNALGDAWGGQNTGSQSQDVYGTEVPAGKEWGVNRGEVERFVKSYLEGHDTKLAHRIGYLRPSATTDVNTFYHIEGFASYADALEYDGDPVANATLLLLDMTFPVPTVKTDSYTAQLAGDRATSPVYVVKSGSAFDVNMQYKSVHLIAATSSSENYGAAGTLTVERSVDAGNSWTQVEKRSVRPSEIADTDYPIALSLGGYLIADRQNQLRVRVSFAFTDDGGATSIRSSSYVTYIVNSVNLMVEMVTQWERPITVVSGTSQLVPRFNVYGAVQKTLHVEVDGAAGTASWSGNFDGTYHGTPVDAYLNESTATRILAHGLREVRAWLTCSDGDGGELRSDTVVNHLMVVNTATDGADLTQPYLLLQGVKATVPNFVQSKICGYAVYSPSGENIPLTLLLTSSSGSILNVAQTEYYRLEIDAVPQTQYSLECAVEIEQAAGETQAATLQAFLHATRKPAGNAAGTVTDFLLESTGAGYQYIEVDNSAGYAPTAGSNWQLNPKVRNNTEANPARILNARNGNAVVGSTWTGFKFGQLDGWLTDSAGNKMLRVPAGCLLNIEYNPLAQFLNNPASSLTMEFDICVRNVTNEDDPIISLFETLQNNTIIGLRMRPMIGTLTTQSNTSEATTDFRWQEDERVHISINICDEVSPNVILNGVGDGLTAGGTTQSGSIALVRVFINGVINRELRFDKTAAQEFCTAAMSNNGITIGQEGADIDIYGIRVWESRALSSQNVLQNYIATIPDQAEKARLKRENDIMTSRRVSVDKVKSIGKRVLIWHGDEPYHQNTNTVKGWWEFFQYDNSGNLLPELSGTICRETKSLSAKRQGTTANTYYYSNIQTKLSDVEDTIIVALTELHESITQGEIVTEDGAAYIELKGGCLGRDFPLPSETFKQYPIRVVDGVQYVIVPDGWVDGNGKYRGMGYTVAVGLPLAQKLVLKSNYASSMQSHIVGVNQLYNDLHGLYVGKNALQQAVPGAVVAKHLEPFLFFTQAEGSDTVIYRGPCTWGAGKMDKPSWGYVKSAYSNFTMIEGADNSKELTDMRVPFDDEAHGEAPAKVYYDPDNEAWYYRLHGGDPQKCIDFDGGKTTVVDGKEYPHANIVSYIRSTWNFLFLHNPRIKYFDGSYASFLQSNAALDVNNKYWCRSAGGNDGHDFKLKRYDFTDAEWVDAGLWNGEAYAEVNLLDSENDAFGTYSAWQALSTNEKTDYAGKVNAAFISAIVNHAKLHIGEYFVVNSLKFHYVFENHFIAGTDNCSKNTYYVLVPVTENGETVWKFELHQDDVDTVLATDNSGLQTKPYYIDRMHPYADSDVNRVNCLYEGVNNVLFNLCEEMWEASGELGDAMREVLSHMASLNVTHPGTAASASMTGVWGTLNKYIFDVQRYIPAMAFNEAARIRYEFPAMIGYVSDQRNVDPIEQSMGDQLQAELQFMKRRLVYMASYAAFGEFNVANNRNGSMGLSDGDDSFSMWGVQLPNGAAPTFHFDLVPHQYIYPTAGIQTSLINRHVRVAPGEHFQLSQTLTTAIDDGMAIFGINYYRSVGNIGDNPFDPAKTLTLNGKRMTEFVAEPTKWWPTAETIAGGADANTYMTEPTAGYLPAFRCTGVNINATRLATLSMKGCTSVGGGAVNLSNLTRLVTIDLRGTDLTSVRVPETETLTTLRLPAGLTSLTLTAQPNLATLALEGGMSLTSLEVTGSPLADTQGLLQTIYSQRLSAGANPAALGTLKLHGMAWADVNADLLMWMAGGVGGETADRSVSLKGSIVMLPSTSDRWLSFQEVVTLIRLFGDIQDSASAANGLYIDYPKRDINGMVIRGSKYLERTGSQDVWSAAATNDVGNNVAIIGGREAISFTLVEAAAATYAEITDAVKGTVNVLQTYSPTTYLTFTLRMNVTLIDNTTISVTKKVGFHKRLPKLGDFAFADGSFDDELDVSKTLVGCVTDKKRITDEQYELTVYAKENATVRSTDGNYNTAGLPWGIYPSSDNNGFPSTFYNSEDADGIKERSGLGNVVDTAMTNIGSSGFTGTYLTDQGGAFGSGPYLDASQADGYAQLNSGAVADFRGKDKTAIVIAHANAIINGYLGQSYPQTPTALADAMQALVAAKTEEGDTAPGRWRQLYYPASYACYLYEPTVQAGETLHDAYKRKNWFLPATGQLCRIYNFFYNSCGRVTYENGGRVTVENANDNPQSDALLPLFANLLVRIAAAGLANNSPFTMPSGSNYWSVTENGSGSAWYVGFSTGYVSNGAKYYGLVARAVTAFTFNL